jgi:site-specific DNA-methyltransferase (adenine-specific)
VDEATKGGLMRPYYEHAGITIFHGDCREILPHVEHCDLLLTDPPYGIAKVWKGGSGHGWATASGQTMERNEWDAAAPDAATLALAISKADAAIIWGGNYFELPPSRCWLVWNKPERNFTLAEAELAWTSRDALVRVFDGPRSDVGRTHPTQKPLRLMSWCIGLVKKAGSVLDPFMGSGTTLVAAKNLGRKAIGIEIEERYCEIAAKRLSQEVLPLMGGV